MILKSDKNQKVKNKENTVNKENIIKEENIIDENNLEMKQEVTEEIKEKKKREKINIRDLLRNRLVLAVIAITLSFVIVFGSSLAGSLLLKEKVTVYSVKKDIQKGIQISEDMIVKTDISKLGLTSDVIFEKSEIVGKYAVTDLFEGDIFRNKKISEKIPYEFEYLSTLKDNEFAYTLKVDEPRDVISSKIRSGDIISVIPKKDTGNNEERTDIPNELKYIEVLAIINDMMNDVKNSSDINKDNPITSIIVKARNFRQLVSLANANTEGVSVALVCRDNPEKANVLLNSKFDEREEN